MDMIPSKHLHVWQGKAVMLLPVSTWSLKNVEPTNNQWYNRRNCLDILRHAGAVSFDLTQICSLQARRNHRNSLRRSSHAQVQEIVGIFMHIPDRKLNHANATVPIEPYQVLSFFSSTAIVTLKHLRWLGPKMSDDTTFPRWSHRDEQRQCAQSSIGIKTVHKVRKYDEQQILSDKVRKRICISFILRTSKDRIICTLTWKCQHKEKKPSGQAKRINSTHSNSASIDANVELTFIPQDSMWRFGLDLFIKSFERGHHIARAALKKSFPTGKKVFQGAWWLFSNWSLGVFL